VTELYCPSGCEAGERWAPAPPNPEYEVSSRGRVRRRVVEGRRHSGRLLSPWTSNRGYLYVHLGARVRGQAVHRMVLEVFGPPRPTGTSVDHLDWDKRHNCAANLRWLAVDLNSVRWWHARDAAGGNVWATKDDPPPPDHVPMTPEEEAEWRREVERTGPW